MPGQNFRARGEILSGDPIDLCIDWKIDSQKKRNYQHSGAHKAIITRKIASTKPIRAQYNRPMNHKRGFPAFLATFVFIFFFEFLWHGMLMKGMYMEVASLWRAEPIFPLLVLGQVVIAFAFTGLYVSKIGVNSPAIGAGYGIMIGILCAGGDIIRFSVQPITTKILWMWIAGGIIELAIAGAIVGAIYKPRTA